MEWQTTYPAAAWIRLVLFSLIGIAPHAIVPIGMIGIDVGDWMKLDHDFDPVVLGMCALVLIVSIALPLVCLKMRDPGPGKIVPDAWGVTEWSGSGVRTAIPWQRASAWVLETRVSSKYGQRWVGGVAMCVASDQGWTINAMWGRWTRECLRRRIVSKEEFSVGAVARSIPAGVHQMQDRLWDRRDARRGLFWFSRIVGVLFLAASGGAIAQATNDLSTNGAQLAGLLYFVAAIFAVLRALRPLVENVRISRDAVRNAVRVQLPAGLDFSGVVHPDMALGQRGIPLFVALQGPRVLAVETEHDRRERSRIENANRIEIACRVFLAMTMVVVSVILLAGLQVH